MTGGRCFSISTTIEDMCGNARSGSRLKNVSFIATIVGIISVSSHEVCRSVWSCVANHVPRITTASNKYKKSAGQ